MFSLVMDANTLYAQLQNWHQKQSPRVATLPFVVKQEFSEEETSSDSDDDSGSETVRWRRHEEDHRAAFEARSERTKVARALLRSRGKTSTVATYAELLSGRSEFNVLRDVVSKVCTLAAVRLDVSVDLLVVEIERFLFALMQLEPVYRTALSGRGFRPAFCEDYDRTHRFVFKLRMALNIVPALKITDVDTLTVFAEAVSSGTFARAFEYMRAHEHASRNGLGVQLSRNMGLTTETLQYIIFSDDFNTWMTAVCGKMMIENVQVNKDPNVLRSLLMASSALVALRTHSQTQLTAALVWMHVAVDAYINALHDIATKIVQFAFYRNPRRDALIDHLAEYAEANLDVLRDIFVESGASDAFVHKFNARNVRTIIKQWPRVVRTSHANGKGLLMFFLLVGYKRMSEIMNAGFTNVEEVYKQALRSDTPYVRQCVVAGLLLKMVLLLCPVQRTKPTHFR